MTKKKCTAVWPAMFFSVFKLIPEKILARKKKYSRQAVSWKLEKNTSGKKGMYSRLVVSWSTKHKTQHTS